jgi:ABC-2 type transport system ATP-binding protein
LKIQEGKKMIEVQHLSKRYGENVALNDISFSVDENTVVGFLGPNGAGKSTTMNIITGYLSASSGVVNVGGYNTLDDPNEVKKQIGYMPEVPPLYTDMTVEEYLDFIYDLKKVTLPRKKHINEICSLVKIREVYHRLIGNLSKGYRQRVGFAQALIGNPPVLILDEPTVGLDPKQIIDMRNLIKNLGKNHTVILSSHILPEIQAVCERILIINRGNLVADGTPYELESNVSDEHRLVVRIEGNGSEVEKSLRGMKDALSVENYGEKEPGVHEFVLEGKDGCDLRRTVFSLASKRNWPILSMSSTGMSLEDLFLRLTSTTYLRDNALIRNAMKGGDKK